MKILAFDTETTGLPADPKTSIVELAFAVYDTEADRIVKCFSCMVKTLTDENKMTEGASKVNGITDEQIEKHGLNRGQVFPLIYRTMDECDAVMAFNAPFDKEMIEREFTRDKIAYQSNTPWICAMRDIEYPDHVRGRNQGHIAADLGFLNPFPHVAVGDILTMIQICRTLGFSDRQWKDLIVTAQSPMITVKAHVNFDNNQMAKDEKFYWKPAPVKAWLKDIRQCQLEELKSRIKFEITIQN